MSATLTLNGTRIPALIGQVVLDAARKSGVAIAHDCANGLCEACRITVEAGTVDAAGTAYGDTVLACQARVIADASIRFDLTPREMKSSGIIRSVRGLSNDIIEVMVEVKTAIPYLPGQYIKLSVGKGREQTLCPTLSLDGLREIETLYFHIRKQADHQAEAYKPGQKVSVRGPFGQGFLRYGTGETENGRIVLISSGVGFAPIWSMAVAARLGQPHRPLVLIASAHDPRNLYMRPAFDWLAKHGVNDLILTASAACPMPPAKFGRATLFIPPLKPNDTVHVAGHIGLTKAVQESAAKAGARCYAIPFVATQQAPDTSLTHRLARLILPAANDRGNIASKA